MFHPDDQERAWSRWEHSLATGEPYEIEYRLRHHTGGYRWTLGRAMPIRDADGQIERWFGTCTDIDDLKRAEGEARKLAAIVEASKDFIGLATEDGQISHLNEAALALVGLPDLAAAQTLTIPDLFTPESRLRLGGHRHAGGQARRLVGGGTRPPPPDDRREHRRPVHDLHRPRRGGGGGRLRYRDP